MCQKTRDTPASCALCGKGHYEIRWAVNVLIFSLVLYWISLISFYISKNSLIKVLTTSNLLLEILLDVKDSSTHSSFKRVY